MIDSTWNLHTGGVLSLASQSLREAMIRSLDDLLEELKSDIARWKGELVGMKRDGHEDLAARVEEWIQGAEAVVSSYSKPK